MASSYFNKRDSFWCSHVCLVHVFNDQLHVLFTLLQSFGCFDNVKPPLVCGFPLSSKPLVMPCHKLSVHVIVTQQRAPIDNKAVANHKLARKLVQIKPLHDPGSHVFRHAVRGLRQ